MQLLAYTVAVLYALAMLVLLAYGLNLLWLAVRRALAERLRPGLPPDPEAVPTAASTWPDVTVQIPLYNEPFVAARVIDACARLAYPRHRLEIQVLDDSTDETREIAAERVAYWRERGVDMLHVHRPSREGYKAGALQNGLRMARGSLIAIFDADFLPGRDFLLRTVPRFAEPDLGLVQARWGHLNADASLLTRLQAMGLDVHFAVEQRVRSEAGLFMNFNGTAGVWRRACIEDAGGWQADTLTEDLDLSYRAQMRGWRFAFLPDLEVPAELPPDLDAFSAQQHRWTKGAIETSIKLLRPLWRSSQPLGVKVEGTFHLTAHTVFPLALLGALLHPPLVLFRRFGYGPGEGYFAVMMLGLLGLTGFVLAHVFAQRELYPDWGRRMRLFPLFMAGTMGIALSNSQAVWQALRRIRTPFVRTPKYSLGMGNRRPVKQESKGGLRWPEAVLALYAAVGLVLMLRMEIWAAVPLQTAYLLGFALVALNPTRATASEGVEGRGFGEPAPRAYFG